MTPATPDGAARRVPELEETAVERAERALDDGDLAAAREQLAAILAEARPIHDIYGDGLASLVTFVAEELGEDAVERAWRRVADDCWRPVLEGMREHGPAALAAALAAFLISHRYVFTVHEDDERWTFEVAECTSGERMLREGKVAGMGASEGPHAFGATATARDWTLGFERLPYYDVHSAIYFRLLPREIGWDVMDVEYEDRGQGPVVARYLVFKRPR